MKKNLGMIITIIVALVICAIFGVLIFRPAFFSEMNAYIASLKANPEITQDVIVSSEVKEAEVTAPEIGGKDCGGLKGGCASGGVESTGSEVNLNASSDEKILDTNMTEKEILAKIDDDSEKSNDATGILIQGDFKAEFIPSENNTDDKIKISKNGEDSFVTLNKSNEANRAIKKLYDTGKCIKGKETIQAGCFSGIAFDKFGQLCGDGKYLGYYSAGYEGGPFFQMIDIKNGIIIDSISGGMEVLCASNGSKLVYGDKEAYGDGGNLGLYDGKSKNIVLLESGWDNSQSFLSSYLVKGLFMDEKYAYGKIFVSKESTATMTGKGNGEGDVQGMYFKIFDLKTLKEIYSKEIK